MTSYIGNQPGLNSRVIWRFEATSSQAVFTGIDINGLNLNFNGYDIDVYVNGLRYIKDIQYSATGGNTITFSSGLTLGDDVIILGVGAFNVADTYTKAEIDGIANSRVFWRFIATESQTVLTGTDFNSVLLDFTGYGIDVFVNGSLLTRNVDYMTSDGDTITVSNPLTEDDEVIVIGQKLYAVADAYTKAEIDGFFDGVGAGGGFFKGNNGEVGEPLTGRGDIFRINNTILESNTVIANTENASTTGPLEVANNITLTVEGTLVII